MDAALEKWMIIRFTPYQTTTLPKWMFSQIFFQIILAAKWLVRHSSTVHPLTNSDDFCLLFCLYLSSVA